MYRLSLHYHLTVWWRFVSICKRKYPSNIYPQYVWWAAIRLSSGLFLGERDEVCQVTSLMKGSYDGFNYSVRDHQGRMRNVSTFSDNRACVQYGSVGTTTKVKTGTGNWLVVDDWYTLCTFGDIFNATSCHADLFYGWMQNAGSRRRGRLNSSG